MACMRSDEPVIRSRARLGCLCLLVIADADCGGGSEACTSHPADFASYGFQVESASVSWALDSVPMHSAAVVAEQPSVGDCQLSIADGLVAIPSDPAGCPGGHDATISLDCVVTAEHPTAPQTRDPNARWLIEVGGLGDPRAWSVGSVDGPTPNPEEAATPYVLETYPLYLHHSAGCRSSDAMTGGAASLQATVEEAVGGRADYPSTVTSDYRRVLRIDLDRSVTLLTDGGATCTVPAATNISLRLVQTSADFTITQGQCIDMCP